MKNCHLYLATDIERATEELRACVEQITHSLTLRGYSYHVVDVPMDDYSKLSLHTSIPVSTVGNSGTILGDDHNLMLRFWHDVTHLLNNKGFSKQDELFVIHKQLDLLKTLTSNPLVLRIFYSDMVGQVLYYDKYKKFVKNQLDFTFACVQLGILNVLRTGREF